jgi:hypothetical protein
MINFMETRFRSIACGPRQRNMAMTFNRYARPPALSTLLRGWDDAGRKQQTRMPLMAAVEIAAPSADMAAWTDDKADAPALMPPTANELRDAQVAVLATYPGS